MRACTSEWLPPCFQERFDLPRDSQRHGSMRQDVLGRQQAGTTAALQRGLEQRHSLEGRCGGMKVQCIRGTYPDTVAFVTPAVTFYAAGAP